ncbi:MAG: peptidylprolyl isomerase [Acidobacteriota bacterium]|nr:peptidylprolyl isomerase [Acidobacteriota bacterium]
MRLALLALILLQAKPPQFFTSTLTPGQLTNQQAVVETTHGTFVFELLGAKAPTHVAYFMTKAREGAYAGTTFHRVIKLGLIQGGDPLSRDPAMSHRYGTGGLGVLRAEFNDEPFVAGIVGAVLVPGQKDSAGLQFFVNASDQLALNGQYTAFGRVVEGLDVVRKISELPASPRGLPEARVIITRVTIRSTPPPEPEPFADVPDAALGNYVASIETTKGAIEIELLPGKAPGHVRNFLRLASAGVYDGTLFHRSVKGFVVQTGALLHRGAALTPKQQALVPATLAPEFNDTPHVKGVLSMARGDDPSSASTSFFICTAVCPSLDGKYTAFGRVTRGLEVVDAIEAAPVVGELPVEKIEIVTVRVRLR